MIPLSLSHSERQALHQTLAATHVMRVRVEILNLSGDRVSDVSDRLLSGQVNVDGTAEIGRSCTMSLIDPDRTLAFDSDSPTPTALYLDRMLRVVYGVKVGDDWVDIPVFTGPVSKMDRTDAVVNLEAQGKETLAMGVAWKTHTYKKGKYRHRAVREILNDMAGETDFRFTERTAQLPHDLSVGRESVPWTVAKSIADSMDMKLFYDGAGTCVLRRDPGNPTFTFGDGDGDGIGGNILTVPQVSYSTENLRNVVMVKGAKNIVVTRAAPYTHPLSPQRLGRRLGDGTLVPRFLLEVVSNGAIRTKSEAATVAENRLERALLTAAEVAFDAMPVPDLDAGDVVILRTAQLTTKFRVQQFSIPLVVGESMSLGYLRQVSTNQKRIRG